MAVNRLTLSNLGIALTDLFPVLLIYVFFNSSFALETCHISPQNKMMFKHNVRNLVRNIILFFLKRLPAMFLSGF